MTRLFVITMKEIPKSINAKGGGTGAHHMQAHKEKKRWEGLYLMEFMVAKIPKNATHVEVGVTLRWRRRPGKPPEKENYRQPVIKPLADAMMYGGYIPDDNDSIFEVSRFTIEFPQDWPYADPRVKHELILCIEAEYDG